MSKTEDAYMRKLQAVMNRSIRKMADEISNTMEKKYKFAIEKFYNDYDPWMYERGYNLYRGYKKVKEKNENGWTCGINVNAEYLGSNPYHQGLEYVFDRSFYLGIHGVDKNDMINRRDNVDQIKAFSRELAGLKPLYANMSRIPGKMKPPPKEILDKEFKQLTKKKNMDEMFNKYIAKELKNIKF